MKIFKKTKIVATIGPATEDKKVLSNLVDAGLDVMRLNFSHGDHAEHQARVDTFREIAKEKNISLAVLQDLSGPKIRIGEFYKDRVNLKPGSAFILTTKKIIGDETQAYVNYPKLPKELKPGNFVLLDDGKKRLCVTKVVGNEIHTKVVIGGETKGRRGVNLPGAHLSISSITKKDREDLVFGFKNKVDFIALSFVRDPKDVKELRGLLEKGKSDAHIISKIETQEAIDNIDEIIALSDGIMVARGDLAIEVPAEQVPLLQKMIIEKCNLQGKPVITATQMLESMIKLPVPTRAEVSDIANAIFDGTDGIMLSEETTLGEYPLEAVSVMTRVAQEVEEKYSEEVALNIPKEDATHVDTTDSITASVVNTAHEVGAKGIVAITTQGFTARQISRFKPDPFIVAISENQRACNRLALSYGCIPTYVEKIKDFDHAIAQAKEYIKKYKFAKKGDKIVVAGSIPFDRKLPKTNMMVVVEV